MIWGLLAAAFVSNIFGLNDIVWTNGTATLTRDRLAPAWSALGWFVLTVGALVAIRTTYTRSRQPLLRNRLNYWTPVFLLIFVNNILLIAGRNIPGNPFRLGAAILAAFIIVTHDPPDLRQIARRVLTYIITTFVVVGFYVAGFSASQRAFDALPNYNHCQRCVLERLVVIAWKFESSDKNCQNDHDCDEISHRLSLTYGRRTVQSIQPGMRPSAAVFGGPPEGSRSRSRVGSRRTDER